jgi:putative endonuclease
MQHYIYIAECSDGSYYTGYTTDLEKRALIHNSGKGAKYTRSRLPVKIVHSEEFSSKIDAMKREAAIKKLKRSAKVALIRSGARTQKLLQDACDAQIAPEQSDPQ